jgi:hypothetical protein
MIINRNAFAALIAILISVFSSGTLYADTIQFGVGGHPIDLSANVKDSILPGGIVSQESKPLFGTIPSPKQSAELLYLSPIGVNASGHSPNIFSAFSSSLAESNGNGGVGVSQLLFGSPSASSQDALRQLVAQSLWTQTFVYNGTDPLDLTMHLHFPKLEVQLFDVPPRRTGVSAAETAQASASFVATITHPDLTSITGSRFDFGLREFERQIPSGRDLLNFGDIEALGQTGTVTQSVNFNGDDFNPGFTIDPVSLDLDVGTLHTGDTFSYVYTLTAEGTTHGFERGYDAFLGDPFGGDVITDNLRLTGTTVPTSPPGVVPEAKTSSLVLLGLAGLFVWRWHKVRSFRSGPEHQLP